MPQPIPAPPALRGLYVITDTVLGGGHLQMARAALAGGSKILQLRDKSAPSPQILSIARELRALTRQNGALLIINDDLGLALECGADGVHLGEDDVPLLQARRALGPDKIIGVSASTPALARAALQGGASYLGVGAVFGTATKADAGPAIGIQGLRAVIGATSLPVAAIGGLNAANLTSVLQAGAQMACVISALCARSLNINGAHHGNGNDAAQNERLMIETARELVAICEVEAQAREAGTLEAGTLEAGTLEAGTLEAGTLEAGSAR